MSINNAKYPGEYWDGTTPIRGSLLVDKSPEYEDWDQIIAELRATQHIAPLMVPRKTTLKGSNYLLTEDDDGTLIVATAACALTLPIKREGYAIRFAQHADADLTINGQLDLIHKGTNTGTSVAWQTAGQKIGSQGMAECVNINGTLKWLISNIGGTTATVA